MMPRFLAQWLWIPAFAGMTLAVGNRSFAQTSDLTEFPVMTKTLTDSGDPSLPVTQVAPPQAEPIPINGDVAAEIAKQLSDADEKTKLHRIYAVKEAPVLSQTMVPVPLLARPSRPVLDLRQRVDETAVLNRMMDMKRSQVMKGVEDVVNRAGGPRTKAKPEPRPRAKGSVHIQAQRLMPESRTDIMRIDPSGEKTQAAPLPR